MAAGLKRKPNIKANPISTNPQAFKTSMVASCCLQKALAASIRFFKVSSDGIF